MTKRVAFLRAVNLGRRTVKMARLVEVFEQLGYDSVWTHINSGNVVFDGSGSRAALQRAIEPALQDAFGFEVTTFVRTAAELRRSVNAQPFDVAGGDTHFVTFLKSPPSVADARALESLSNDMDTLVVQGRDVHWRMHGRSTESSLTSKDWAAIVGERASTSRNMTMLRKLVAKLSA
ncbi:MAG: DUF1697 domain-containing protein [Actinomycetota bacterium]|nr:DUF1697 domain-containing protein [Actinomycetota bacterium]